MDELEDFRRKIDALDDEIVRLLAARFAVVREVADFKAQHNIPVRLADRIEAVIARNAENGARQGIDPAFLRQLYSQIVEASCALEDRLIEADETKVAGT